LDDDFFNALYDRIIHINTNILHDIQMHGSRYNDTKAIIQVKEQELIKQKRALEKLHESFEEDIITKQVYVERKGVRAKQIHILEEELRELRRSFEDEGEVPTVEEIYERVDSFKERWIAAESPEEKNKALKKLVDKILYNREDNRIELTVAYR
jgi:site-specific DNA recombinase